MSIKKQFESVHTVWALVRITLGSIFLWAFFDKLFGLGFSTCRAEDGSIATLCDEAWLGGGSPTSGFLQYATKDSPLKDVYQSMAGNAFWDWLFMIGLFCIGLALVLGVGMYVATITGITLLSLMYLAVFQPENNPIIDQHVVYSLVLVGLWKVNGDQRWGLGGWWAKQSIVRKYPFLR